MTKDVDASCACVSRDEQEQVGQQRRDDSHHGGCPINDSTFVMTPTGKINFKSQYVCEYESPGYLMIFDRSTRLFGLYCPFTNVYIEPKYAYIRPIDRDHFFLVMTPLGKVGYLDGEGKKLFDDKRR